MMIDSDILAWFDDDPAAALDPQPASPPEDRAGVTLHDLRFAAPGGRRVAATLVEPPASIDPPYAGIFWQHWLEPDSPDSDRTQFLPEAIRLARAGVVSILPDAFWATDSERWQLSGRWWRTDFEHDRALVIQQMREMRRALRLLATRTDIDPARLAFVGHDFGAMCGSLLLALEPGRFQGAVLMAGTYSFGEWFVFGSKENDEFKAAYRRQIEVLDPARFIAHSAPAELFFQFASDDFYVPEPAARRFIEAASRAVRIRWYEAGHDLKDAALQSRIDRLDWLRGLLALPEPDAGAAG